jgi:hypothetical protein
MPPQQDAQEYDYGRIILKQILKNYDVRMWTDFIRLKIWFNGRLM